MNVWNIIAIILGTLIIVGSLALIIYLLVSEIKFNKNLDNLNIIVVDPNVELKALKNVLKDRNKYIEYLQNQNENLSKKIKEFWMKKKDSEIIDLLLDRVSSLENNTLWLTKELNKLYDYVEKIANFLNNVVEKNKENNNGGNIN